MPFLVSKGVSQTVESVEVTSPSKSKTVQVSFPDGACHALPSGITAREALGKIKKLLSHETFAVKIDGIPNDLETELDRDVSLVPITFSSAEGPDIYRHSSTHIMAQAVKECFPTANLTIGPAIEEGFFYDFAFERPFTPEDLEKIEQRAHEIIRSDLSITRLEMSKQDAIQFFQERGERYKVELLEGIQDETISLYQQGDFVDLCRGPHVGSTGQIKAFKVLTSSGAYWRGDERNPMLQRIYGTSFPSQKLLDEYLVKLEKLKGGTIENLGKNWICLVSRMKRAQGSFYGIPKAH